MEVDLKLILEAGAALVALGGVLYMVKDHHGRISKNGESINDNVKAISDLAQEVSKLTLVMGLLRDDIKELKSDVKVFFQQKNHE